MRGIIRRLTSGATIWGERLILCGPHRIPNCWKVAVREIAERSTEKGHGDRIGIGIGKRSRLRKATSRHLAVCEPSCPAPRHSGHADGAVEAAGTLMVWAEHRMAIHVASHARPRRRASAASGDSPCSTRRASTSRPESGTIIASVRFLRRGRCTWDTPFGKK
jgi:hypothetical protein